MANVKARAAPSIAHRHSAAALAPDVTRCERPAMAPCPTRARRDRRECPGVVDGMGRGSLDGNVDSAGVEVHGCIPSGRLGVRMC